MAEKVTGFLRDDRFAGSLSALTAIAAGLEEVALLIEARGAVDTHQNVVTALERLDVNAEKHHWCNREATSGGAIEAKCRQQIFWNDISTRNLKVIPVWRQAYLFATPRPFAPPPPRTTYLHSLY